MPRGVFYVVSSDEGEPQAAPRLVYRLASISVGGEGMLGGVALGHDLGRLRLALDGAGNGFLRRGVVTNACINKASCCGILAGWGMEKTRDDFW